MRSELKRAREAVCLSRNELALERTRAFLFVRLDDRYVVPPGLFSCPGADPGFELTIQLRVGHGIVGAAVAKRETVFGRPIEGVPGGRPVTGLEFAKVHPLLDWIVAFPICLDEGEPIAVLSIDGLRTTSDIAGDPTHVPDDILPGIAESLEVRSSLRILETKFRQLG